MNADPAPTFRLRLRVRRLACAVACAAAIGAVGASSAASSAEHPCRLTSFNSVKFVDRVTSTAPQALLRLRDARVICGGPDDEHWDPVGREYTARLAAHAAIWLLPNGDTATPRRATLVQLAQLTRLQAHDPKFGWYGGGYGVRFDSAGRIDSLTELFHP